MTENAENEKAVLNPLKSKRELKKHAAELSDTLIRAAIDQLSEILEDRQREAVEAAKYEEDRQGKLAQLSEMMKELNLSPEDLGNLKVKGAAKRAPVAPKYHIIDNDGNEHTWTGRGRTPAAFASAKANGTLNQYEIQAEEA